MKNVGKDQASQAALRIVASAMPPSLRSGLVPTKRQSIEWPWQNPTLYAYRRYNLANMNPTQKSTGLADVLTLGFGTTTAMWAVGYVCRLPWVNAPAWVLFGLLLLCMVVGGLAAGRYTARGWTGGAWAGLVTAALNLLVLSSLIFSDKTRAVQPAVLLWMPGSLVFGALVGAFAALVGSFFTRKPLEPGSANPIAGLTESRSIARYWPGAFCKVAAITTLLLISTGGAVTSQKAGMAVPDWPTTESYFMFFYPLSRMTGGIYLEHAHRLWGSLVGLTILVLAVLFGRMESRAYVRRLAYGCIPLVVVQGLLGGIRVTHNNLTLALIHGVFAQVFLATLVALVVFTSTRWRQAEQAGKADSARGPLGLGVVTIVATIVQLVLGAGQRHLSGEIGALLILHITMAFVVAFLAVALALTVWSRADQPLLVKLGKGMIHTVSFQLLLGLGATIAVGFAGKADPPPLYKVLFTTPHQIVGAVLLALVVATTLFKYRLGGTPASRPLSALRDPPQPMAREESCLQAASPLPCSHD